MNHSIFHDARDDLKEAFGDDPNVESYATTGTGVRVRLHDVSDAPGRPSLVRGVPVEYLPVAGAKAQ